MTESKSALNDWITAYSRARAEHAYVLRMEGLGYRDVGGRLGVGAMQGRSLAQKGERIKRAEAFRAQATE